jgi:exodeoxyribonuclease VII large subunit
VEDLWAFNDERLARAIAACPIPVVSAVGHEVDVSICDLVADVRAATPSHAAELVVPDVRALQSSLEAFDRRLTRAIERVALDQRGRLDRLNARLLTAGRGLTAARAVRLKRLEQALQRSHPRAQLAIRRRRLERLAQRVARCPHLWMRSHRSRLADARSRLLACARTLSRCARTRLGRAAATLGALSPLAVLERGYALVFTEKGLVVRSAAEVGEGETLRVRLCRGQLEVRVTGREPVED